MTLADTAHGQTGDLGVFAVFVILTMPMVMAEIYFWL